MMSQGIWILAWLCLNPLYCTKPVVLPLDTFNHPALCIIMRDEMSKRVPDEKFICTQEGNG